MQIQMPIIFILSRFFVQGSDLPQKYFSNNVTHRADCLRVENPYVLTSKMRISVLEN